MRYEIADKEMFGLRRAFAAQLKNSGFVAQQRLGEGRAPGVSGHIFSSAISHRIIRRATRIARRFLYLQ